MTERPDSISRSQDKALAALDLLREEHGAAIRQTEYVCRQWLAAYVHAGRGCGYRAWRECLSLLDARQPLRLKLAILVRAAKELLKPGIDKK